MADQTFGYGGKVTVGALRDILAKHELPDDSTITLSIDQEGSGGAKRFASNVSAIVIRRNDGAPPRIEFNFHLP